ncbi:cadherin-related family member 5 [Pleuronectes platessa]|uniref:cadherin-related family member 5 n=1 Tax=Pleuronectes platessa TaxID=8262 RepID=UPI00232A58AD|nr:cadherin-related family member 5 [Pleuronectes platessa]
MDLPELKLTPFQAKAPVWLLLVLLCLHTAKGMSGWGGCLDGHDVFVTVRENSPPGEVVAELSSDTTVEGVQWILDGKDKDWFFLDERYIRLNTSVDKALDREAQSPVLMAELQCYEDDLLQSVYRVMVEVLNENDNSPVFAENSTHSLIISELTPVDTVIFTVLATDADNDKIIYSIDKTSPDADYFKLDFPNSGEVILSKPLDYETQPMLTVTIHASEMSTAEHFNTSANITIHVLDGDDQYPQFLPCTLLFQDETSHICTSPVYTVNITEGEEDIVLDFSPGPIYAVDGDRGLSTPLSYAILSGNDDGRVLIDRVTGEMKLTQGVTDRLTTPMLHLQVLAYQDDDPRKYSVATALIRILAVNHFHPVFDEAEYHGFVTAVKSAASLVNTYGGKVLMLHVEDQDFEQGFNPRISFTFSPTSNHTDLYQLTQEGLVIARSNQLKPKQRHTLEVKATDQESGDATFTTVVIEVITEGQSVPHSPLGEERLTGCTVGKAFFLSVVFMTTGGCVLSLVTWLKRKRRGNRDPLERGCVAQGKHPNVSLRCFNLVSHRTAMPHTEEVPNNREEYGLCNPSFSFTDKPAIYTVQDLPTCQGPAAPGAPAALDSSLVLPENVCSPVISIKNASLPIKSSRSPPTSHPATVDLRPTHKAQDAVPSRENPNSPPATPREPPAELPNTSPSPNTPYSRPDSQATTYDDIIDLVTSPSSQSSAPCSQTRIAYAEIDKPFRKSRVKTPPYSPLLSSSHPKQMSTPPPTPEQEPFKAKLVHMDTSPLDTPPVTPQRKSMTLCMEEDQPSTSLDQVDPPQQPCADTSSPSENRRPSEDRRPSENSANTQVDRRAGEEDDDGFLGDEDGDRQSDDALESDEEELLRVMARCNPIFITFSK